MEGVRYSDAEVPEFMSRGRIFSDGHMPCHMLIKFLSPLLDAPTLFGVGVFANKIPVSSAGRPHTF